LKEHEQSRTNKQRSNWPG